MPDEEDTVRDAVVITSTSKASSISSSYPGHIESIIYSRTSPETKAPKYLCKLLAVTLAWSDQGQASLQQHLLPKVIAVRGSRESLSRSIALKILNRPLHLQRKKAGTSDDNVGKKRHRVRTGGKSELQPETDSRTINGPANSLSPDDLPASTGRVSIRQTDVEHSQAQIPLSTPPKRFRKATTTWFAKIQSRSLP